MNKNLLTVVLCAVGLLPMVAHSGFVAEEGVLPEKVASKKSPEPAPVQAPVPTPAEAAKTSPVSTPAPVVPASVWIARAGTSVRKTVEEWGRAADWKVVWEPDDLDYPIPATRTFEGSFQAAITELFEPYRKARRSLFVDGYRGNSVIFVTEKR